MENNLKRCFSCKKYKELSEFHVNNSKKDGFNTYCKSCASEKAAIQYKKFSTKIKKRVRNYRKKFPEKKKEQDKQYYINNMEKIKKYKREWTDKSYKRLRNSRLKKSYGIDLEIYNQMFKNQKGLCAICNDPRSKQKYDFSVDHQHSTGKIRELLCSNCNTGIGLFKEDVELLQKVIIYLNKHNGRF